MPSKYICPFSSSFSNVIKVCRHFDELDGFGIHLTGSWGISAIISWTDKSINYPMVRKMIHDLVTT